jgi:thiamine-monophosphate kinase
MAAISAERARIARLSARFGAGDAAGAGGLVRLGIGDDAAVLALPAGELVWTVDAQVEGVHFRRAWLTWEDVGWRSFMAAASDLAAMGASPVAALSALALPVDFDDDALDALTRGQASAAEALGAPVVGGNFTRAGEVGVTTTLLGRLARPPLMRTGARPGDALFAAGALGLARAGLVALERGMADDPRLVAGVRAWRRPCARIDDGLALDPAARAAIDVSDGLAADAAHLAEAAGLAVVLDAERLLAHAATAAPGVPFADAAHALGEDPMALALAGGEDYALLVVAPPGALLAPFSAIGDFAPGSGVHLRTRTGTRPIDPKGFDHFG